MAPKLSIILPYLSNSTCVARCKEQLARNSVNAFEACEVLDCRAIYRAYNEGVAQAKGEIVVLLNDDMFVAPDWDRLLVEAALGRTVVTTYLVESGKRPVNFRNIERDFGRTAATFDAEGFARFAARHGASVPESRTGLGWYMPFAVRREDFIPFTTEPEDHPNDVMLFGKFASRGYKFVQVRSFAYHLQGMSHLD